MSTLTRRFLSILATVAMMGMLVSSAVAQEGEQPAEEPAAEPAADQPADAAGLSEEQMDYVAISGTVACYNKRVSDAAKANKAINAFLEAEGLTLDEYQAMEKKFRGDAAVQQAIKDEMSLCDTKVLSMPEEAEEVAEEKLTDEEKKEIEEAETKKIWTYSKKVYKGTTSKGGVTNGRITFAFNKNGRNVKGNFGGRLKGQTFSLGLSGVRGKKDHKVTLKGTSGKKNSATVSVTFTKKVTKDYKKSGQDYEHYNEASGNFKGKINGADVSFSFTAESKM